MFRRLAGVLAFASSLTVALTAHAQPMPSTVLAKDDFIIELERKVRDGDKDVWRLVGGTELLFFFNRARCECNEQIRFVIRLSPSGLAKAASFPNSAVNVLLGPDGCASNDAATRTASFCAKVSTRSSDFLLQGFGLGARSRHYVETTVGRLFRWQKNRECWDFIPKMKVWLVITSSTSTTKPELADDAAPAFTMDLDGRAPTAPANVRAVGGNEALEVSWDPTPTTDDNNGYAVFCSRGEDLQVFNPSYYDGQYQSVITRCNGEPAQNADPPPTAPFYGTPANDPPATTPDDAAAGGNAPLHFRRLDGRFMCHDQLSATTTNARIQGLQNGIPYLVGVAALDKRGNASPISVVTLGSPLPTRDFYQEYRDAGGNAEGGFCAFGRGRAGLGLGSLLVGAVAILAGRARARRRS